MKFQGTRMTHGKLRFFFCCPILLLVVCLLSVLQSKVIQIKPVLSRFSNLMSLLILRFSNHQTGSWHLFSSQAYGVIFMTRRLFTPKQIKPHNCTAQSVPENVQTHGHTSKSKFQLLTSNCSQNRRPKSVAVQRSQSIAYFCNYNVF